MGNAQILLGANSIKKVYEESLNDSPLDIVCLAQNYTGVIGDYFEKEYAPKLYGKVTTREIVPDTKENRQEAENKDKSKNAVKFLKGNSETDLILSKSQAVLISYNQESPMAVVITDPELVKSFHLQFEALWKSL